MRKKIENDDKYVKFGITIHPDIDKLLEEKSKENNMSKSKLIQYIMIEHFKNKK